MKISAKSGPRHHTYFRVGCGEQPPALKLEFRHQMPALTDQSDFADQALQHPPSAIYLPRRDVHLVP